MVDSFQERKFEERSIRVIMTHVEGSTTHWFSCCLVLRDQKIGVRKDFVYMVTHSDRIEWKSRNA